MAETVVRRLVALLLSAPAGVHVREAARQIGAAAAPTARALQTMEQRTWATSERQGRRRIYRWANTPQARAAAVLNGPPIAAAGGGSRPYFAWDLDVSWEGFGAMLSSANAEKRRMALARLLTAGRWSDIWRLVTPEQVARDIDSLAIPRRDAWHALVASA